MQQSFVWFFILTPGPDFLPRDLEQFVRQQPAAFHQEAARECRLRGLLREDEIAAIETGVDKLMKDADYHVGFINVMRIRAKGKPWPPPPDPDEADPD